MKTLLKKTTLAAPALALLATAAFPDSGGHYHTDGIANCNCTKTSAELQVCMSKTIQIDVGDGTYITISTGFSETNCATQTVAPGQCIYYQYNSKCSYSFWWGWSCTLTSSSLKTRPATQADCFSSQ